MTSIHVPPGEGQHYPMIDGDHVAKATVQDSAGSFEVFEVVAPAAPMAPPHVSPWSGVLYLVEGRVTALVGDPLAVAAELPRPGVATEALMVLIRGALERLVTTLAAQGRQPAAVALTLAFDDGQGAQPAGTSPHTITRELRLPCPLAHAAPIAARCRALLARWPLHQPVCGIRITVTATAPLPPPQPGWAGLVG